MWRNTSTKLDLRRSIVRVFALVLVLLASMLAAYAYGRSQSPASLSGENQESVRLYAEALKEVEDDYVDQEAVDPEKQTYGAIQGMIESLGDEGHTRFLTPEEVERNRQGLSGKYVGIGVQLENREERVVVSSPIDGSPADEAGVKTGDVIVAVDGKGVEGEDVAQIAEKVRGPEGSPVELTVRRGEEEQSFKLEREELAVETASWNLIPGTDVAHLRLASFSQDAAEQLRSAMDEAREAGAERFILDLRDNPGGQVDQAVGVAELFLGPEEVVYVRRDASGEKDEVRTSDDAEPTDAPVVVLTNGGTASSAEIVAGALRDNGRAKVVGETTFGTGTVLAERTLSDGSAILLGIAEWLTPNGDFIRESGIEPDVRVVLAEGQEPLIPGEEEEMTREEILDGDAQLSPAFEALEGAPPQEEPPQASSQALRAPDGGA
ncbi:MAG: S41 family peptidase [Actinomycetota bacterium]|nr:S41 family peptidase [Actinomycetota bacterium]